MIRCNGRCLNKTIRIVNQILNFFGIVMIIYSLWLLKIWDKNVSELPTAASVPRPWFIYTCLGAGIFVCLSTIAAHVVANCINNYILATYIISTCSLLVIQAGVIVTIFFRMDWESKINKYIDEHHQAFKSFILFHLVMCRIVSIFIFVAQVSAAGLATILWFVGGEPMICSHISNAPDLDQSFLVVSDDHSVADGSKNLSETSKFNQTG